MTTHFIGVDVGTGSARAGVFDEFGTLLGTGKTDISIWRDAGRVVEQSSDDIWRAVCASVRAAMAQAKSEPSFIRGIGFDATCSLVVVGQGGAPLPVGPSDEPERNVIVWMDHRATEQADRINRLSLDVLNYVGGRISPEMETPKLLWLAENKAATFEAAWQFFDLADYLTWKSTGSLIRSICTTTCKWTYLAHEARWDEDYFRQIGLGTLADERFRRIGVEIVPPGTPLGQGLTREAADELGLLPGTAVAAGLIDAHAGGIATVGARGDAGPPMSRMAYVFGTSACTLSSTREPTYVSGVWGPYYSVMLPGLWLNDGGQSAAGAAIDHLVHMHPYSPQAAARAAQAGVGLVDWLAREAERRGGAAALPSLVGAVHVVPEFLGNRAPFADPDARAVIAGLDLDTSLEGLLALYLAGLCGLGYGALQIIRASQEKQVSVDTIVASGGAVRNPLVRQVLADATGMAVVMPASPEPMLLGSAMLGAVAAGRYDSIDAAMPAMSELAEAVRPNMELANWHRSRLHAFEALQTAARDIRA